MQPRSDPPKLMNGHGRDYWGPRLWAILHAVASSYTVPELNLYRKFYTCALLNIIPCGECKDHTRRYISETPPALTSRRALQLWTHTFHNYVNIRLGKPHYNLHAHQTAPLQQGSLREHYVHIVLLFQQSDTPGEALNYFIFFMQQKLTTECTDSLIRERS